MKEFEEALQLLNEICNVPRSVDETTKPLIFDVNNEKHRQQLICNLSVSYDRIYRIEKFLKKYNSIV